MPSLADAGRGSYLNQPRFQVLVYDDVIPVKLETMAIIDHHILTSLHFSTPSPASLNEAGELQSKLYDHKNLEQAVSQEPWHRENGKHGTVNA